MELVRVRVNIIQPGLSKNSAPEKTSMYYVRERQLKLLQVLPTPVNIIQPGLSKYSALEKTSMYSTLWGEATEVVASVANYG
jgi:hypothetical protein